MRISGVPFVVIIMMTSSLIHVLPVEAVEEGQFVKKEGRWEYYSGEDPGLKYFYLKGIITEDEYNKGLRVLETKERITKPNFNIDVNNGLNICVGEKFFLKIRLLEQVRYSYSTFNNAWGTVGDWGKKEFRGARLRFGLSNDRL